MFRNKSVAEVATSSGPAEESFKKGRMAVQSSWSSGATVSVAGGASVTKGLGGTFWLTEAVGRAWGAISGT